MLIVQRPFTGAVHCGQVRNNAVRALLPPAAPPPPESLLVCLDQDCIPDRRFLESHERRFDIRRSGTRVPGRSHPRTDRIDHRGGIRSGRFGGAAHPGADRRSPQAPPPSRASVVGCSGSASPRRTNRRSSGPTSRSRSARTSRSTGSTRPTAATGRKTTTSCATALRDRLPPVDRRARSDGVPPVPRDPRPDGLARRAERPQIPFHRAGPLRDSGWTRRPIVRASRISRCTKPARGRQDHPMPTRRRSTRRTSRFSATAGEDGGA